MSALATYNIKFMALINLKYNKSLEFITPNRDGIVIWDRTNDVNGMYELIDLMVDCNPTYLAKKEVNIDYFSINNFLLYDKPSKYWLNNSIKKYTKFFICNYDNELPDVVEKQLPIPSKFLCYYSDYPKKLQSFIENANDMFSNNKLFDYIEVSESQINTYVNDVKSKEICITDYNWEDKYNIIAKSKFIIINEIDVHLIANCIALQVIPVISDNISLLDLKQDLHYIRKSDFDKQLCNYEIMANELNVYYNKFMKPSSVLQRLLYHIFIGGI